MTKKYYSGRMVKELMSTKIAEQKKQAQKEVYEWSCEWWNERRKNNDVWRIQVDDLYNQFLEDMENKFGED